MEQRTGARIHHQRRGGERRRVVQRGQHGCLGAMRIRQPGDQHARQEAYAHEHQEQDRRTASDV